jgi:hypothetical protein
MDQFSKEITNASWFGYGIKGWGQGC